MTWSFANRDYSPTSCTRICYWRDQNFIIHCAIHTVDFLWLVFNVFLKKTPEISNSIRLEVFCFKLDRIFFHWRFWVYLSLGMSFTKALLPGEAVESRPCTNCCCAACVSCNRMKIPGSVICWRDFAELSVMFALQKGRVFLFHTSVHGLRGVITQRVSPGRYHRTWGMPQAFSMEVSQELALVLRSGGLCVVQIFFSTDTKLD